MTFLPEGYENLKSTKNYWKLSQMKEGDNRLRIVGRPIAGWIEWKDNKPLRYKPSDKPKKPVDPLKPLRPFWDCYVWDYDREDLFILEITQSGILKALSNIAEDEDWGDFTQYDIKIKKEGNGMETRYSLTPLPHKPISEQIVDALASSPVRLEALYESGDPWDLSESKSEPKKEVVTEANLSPRETLEAFLIDEGLDPVYMEQYFDHYSTKNKMDVEFLIQSSLDPKNRKLFVTSYKKFIEE
jgi:hypothetical protein